MRRCHYEVLGVERDVDDSSLKKTYRKLALKWHPDKNLDNAEESTKVFREIQQAYDVLADPQERAFYDKHREQILRGGEDYVDNSLNLMKYFSPSAYTGFGDDDTSFYTIYSWVFKTVAEEDAEFVDNMEEFLDEVPEFGKSDSDYEEVVEGFYAYWQSYCTKKSYVWHEKYDIREAPNRRVLRMIEKENKKLRDAAKKERNEEVRTLVKFVKKRDKRVKAYMEHLKEKEVERKQMVEKRKLEAKKEREKMFQEYEEQEWASMTDLERDLTEMDNHLDSEFGKAGKANDVTESQSDEEEVEQFYCVACDKSFKSGKALTNHEKSRKHKENIALIKEELSKMETIGDESNNDIESNYFYERKESLDQADVMPGNQDGDFVSVGELELQDSLDLNELRIKTTNRYKMKEKQKRKLSGIGESDESLLNSSTGSEEGRRSRSNSRLQRQESVEDNETEEKLTNGNEPHINEDTEKTESLEETKKEDNIDKENEGEQNEPHDKISGTSGALSNSDELPAADTKQGQNKDKDNASGGNHVCNVCKAELSTRNKLFQHIKEKGHALRVEDENKDETTKKGRKKKGNKKKR